MGACLGKRRYVMAIQSEAANRSSIADPEKWLRILQRWRPREPREVLIDFINDLIEAVGPQRIERLDALFVRTDETTRSGREKLDKLRQWREKIRSDPWFWPQPVERDRPVSVLVKKIVDEAPRPLTRFEVERKFRRFRKVPATGLAQELKELANRGEIDRHKQGHYWRKGTAVAPWESYAQRAYKLVYSAADQRVREAELAVALGLSRRDTATVVSQLRKRGLFAPATGNGFVVVSAKSLATLQRGPIFDGRGGIFFVAPERTAPLEGPVFTVLRAERPVERGSGFADVGIYTEPTMPSAQPGFLGGNGDLSDTPNAQDPRALSQTCNGRPTSFHTTSGQCQRGVASHSVVSRGRGTATVPSGYCGPASS
jgi:hypothetical protein